MGISVINSIAEQVWNYPEAFTLPLHIFGPAFCLKLRVTNFDDNLATSSKTKDENPFDGRIQRSPKIDSFYIVFTFPVLSFEPAGILNSLIFM